MATKKTTKKSATRKPAKKASKKARRKNPTDAQKRAWKKLGLLAKRRAAEARRKNGKKKPSKKRVVRKPAARKSPAKKARTARTRNPRYLASALNSSGRSIELGILSAPNKTQALQRAKSLYGSAGYAKFQLKELSKEDVIGGTVTAAAIRKLQTRRAKAAKRKTATPPRARKTAAQPLRARRNPGELYKLFTGETSDSFELVTAPAGTPANIDQLGDFVEFKWMDAEGHRYTVNLEEQGIHCKLAASRNRDGYDQLYVVSTESGELPNFGAYLPQGDVGYIYEITYRARKAHLGDDRPKLYYHRLGEESGRPPILRIDHEGYLHFRDGEYWIEDRGIVN